MFALIEVITGHRRRPQGRGNFSLAPLPVVILLCMASRPCQAHFGDVVYPIPEITDEMLQEIDLFDGLIEEWTELLGEPILTPLDFHLRYDTGFDPSDLNFRIWMGWNATHGRLYIASVFIDDSHVIDLTADAHPWLCSFACDSIFFSIDGDHSGRLSDPELPLDVHVHYQGYAAMAQNSSGPLVLVESFLFPTIWIQYPPYSESGAGAFGENPSIWSIEFYVTPFDLVIPDDREASIPSVLEEGKIIGFDIHIEDADEPQELSRIFLRDPKNWGPESFVDGLLMGIGDGIDASAVQADSWARIKASLAE